MALVTKEQLREHIRSSGWAPIYVLYGDEPFLRDAAVRTIATRCFAEGEMRDFNETEYSLNDPESLVTALAAANQLPMMAARRVVRICDVRVAAASNRDTLKEEFAEVLEKYLKNPSPSSVVIFIADELNGNRKITKLFKEHAAVVEFKKLETAELVGWARSKFDEADTRIDDGTLRQLVSLVGPDLRRLSVEIEKLATAALPGKVVDSDMVAGLVSYTQEIENFDLTDHLVAGRKKQALTVLKKIMDDGAEPVALLGLISYNFRRMLMAKEMMENGAPRDEVARVVKLRYRDQEPFLAASRRADRERLLHILQRLHETDLAIKTSIGGGGPAGSRMQIEMLVCETAMSG
ncbi:MAG: DNA polymerase III subunit delta [Pyrinomonadaceae bacterium]|nr:DNA polymerase III subunit delta [Pyrinomonadaceae bacterium]